MLTDHEGCQQAECQPASLAERRELPSTSALVHLETDCLEAVQSTATESPGCLVLAPTASGQVTPPTV